MSYRPNVFGRLKHHYALAMLRFRGIERVRLHADLTMLGRLALALSRARTVPVRDVKPTRECHYQRITDRPRPRGLEQGGALVVAALGIGIIGTVLVIILVIVAILFFVRRR